jgi:hypothetical protein
VPWCGALCRAVADEPDAEPGWLQNILLGPGSHFALAILCSKAMIPIKLPIAMALTPYVYRYVEPTGYSTVGMLKYRCWHTLGCLGLCCHAGVGCVCK